MRATMLGSQYTPRTSRMSPAMISAEIVLIAVVSNLVVANIASNCSGKASSGAPGTTSRNFPNIYRRQVRATYSVVMTHLLGANGPLAADSRSRQARAAGRHGASSGRTNPGEGAKRSDQNPASAGATVGLPSSSSSSALDGNSMPQMST
jgi:hypothetical protein